MEQKSKKIDVKIIVIITIVVIIAIVEGIVIFTSGNKSNNGKLTQEEQLAVDYLLCNTLISPRDIELYRVWIYQEGDKYYFAYDMTEPQSLIFNSRQIIYASEGGVTKKQIENKNDKVYVPICYANGYSSIKTGITYNWFSSNIEFDTIKKDLKAEIKSINGTLKPIK